jgi:hypothetical protein
MIGRDVQEHRHIAIQPLGQVDLIRESSST